MPYRIYPSRRVETLDALLTDTAALHGERTALLQLRGESRETVSYALLAKRVAALRAAWLAEDFGGASVLLLCSNDIDTVTAFLALASGGGRVVPVSPELRPDALLRLAERTGAAAVIGKTPAAGLGKRLPFLRLDRLHEWVERGEELLVTREAPPPDPDAPAVLYPVSGGRCVSLSQRTLCAGLSAIQEAVRLDENDVFLSVPPIESALGMQCGVLLPLSFGGCAVLGGSVRKLLADMRSSAPTVLLCPPRTVEVLHGHIQGEWKKQGEERRMLAAMRSTDLLAEPMRQAAKSRTFPLIHKMLGGRLRLFLTAGTAQAEAAAGMRSLGFSVLSGYACPECAGFVTLEREGLLCEGASGIPVSSILLDVCNAREDGVGEVRVRGESVMQGYYNEGTPCDALRDGWFYTGVLGALDTDGSLYVRGSVAASIPTEGGRVLPTEVADALRRFAFVRDCRIVKGADGLPMALILPDYKRLFEIPDCKYPNERLSRELARAVAEVNSGTPRARHIRSWRIVTEEFDGKMRK